MEMTPLERIGELERRVDELRDRVSKMEGRDHTPKMFPDYRIPKMFTDHEGGEWMPWDRGPVGLWVMEEAVKSQGEKGNGYCKVVTLNGQTVHSFAFDDVPYPSDMAPVPSFPRWDCINGWTEGFGLPAKMPPDGLLSIELDGGTFHVVDGAGRVMSSHLNSRDAHEAIAKLMGVNIRMG